MKLNKNATMRLAIFTICEVFLKAAEPLKRRNDHSYVMPRRLRGLLSSSFFPCGVSSAHSPFDVSSFLLRQRAKPKFASKFSPRIFSPCQFRAFLISEQDFKFSLTNLKVCEKNRHFGVTFWQGKHHPQKLSSQELAIQQNCKLSSFYGIIPSYAETVWL